MRRLVFISLACLLQQASSCSEVKTMNGRGQQAEPDGGSQDAVAAAESQFYVDQLEASLFSTDRQRRDSLQGTASSYSSEVGALREVLTVAPPPPGSALSADDTPFALKAVKGADRYVFALRACIDADCGCLAKASDDAGYCASLMNVALDAPGPVADVASTLAGLGGSTQKVAAYGIAVDSKSRKVVRGARFFLAADGSLLDLAERLATVPVALSRVPMDLVFDLESDFAFSAAAQDSAGIGVNAFRALVMEEMCSNGGCSEELILGLDAGADGAFRLARDDEAFAMLRAQSYKLKVFAAKAEGGSTVTASAPNLTETIRFTSNPLPYLESLVLTLAETPPDMTFLSSQPLKFKIVPPAPALDAPAIDQYRIAFMQEMCNSSGCHDEELFVKTAGAAGDFILAVDDPDFALFREAGYKLRIWASVEGDDGSMISSEQPNYAGNIIFKRDCAAGGKRYNEVCYYRGAEKGPASSATDGLGDSCAEACGKLGLDFNLAATQQISPKADINVCLSVARLLIPEITEVRRIDSENAQGKYGCGVLFPEANTISGKTEAFVANILSSGEAADVDAATKPRFSGQARICACD